MSHSNHLLTKYYAWKYWVYKCFFTSADKATYFFFFLNRNSNCKWLAWFLLYSFSLGERWIRNQFKACFQPEFITDLKSLGGWNSEELLVKIDWPEMKANNDDTNVSAFSKHNIFVYNWSAFDTLSKQ